MQNRGVNTDTDAGGEECGVVYYDIGWYSGLSRGGRVRDGLVELDSNLFEFVWIDVDSIDVIGDPLGLRGER